MQKKETSLLLYKMKIFQYAVNLNIKAEDLFVGHTLLTLARVGPEKVLKKRIAGKKIQNVANVNLR